MCELCGYCGNCTDICPECAKACADCTPVCAGCGKCESCKPICTDCGRCDDCCAADSESLGCRHGVCAESAEWKTHYCTVGGHCVENPVGPESDEFKHWYICGMGCTVRLGEAPHRFGAGIITKAPSTEEDGILTIPCTICSYEKTEGIPKLTGEHAHSYASVVTPPTCMAGGYTTHTCSCGHSYTDSMTPASEHKYEMRQDVSNHWEECAVCAVRTTPSAHKFGAWEVTIPATYSAPGQRQRGCLFCARSETEVIPQLVVVGQQYVITLENEAGGLFSELFTTGKDHLIPELPVLASGSEGNLFDGWRNKADHLVVTKGQKLSENITIYPVWKDCGADKHTDADINGICDVCGKRLANFYAVTVHNGICTLHGGSSCEHPAGGTVTVKAADIPGSYFLCWEVISGGAVMDSVYVPQTSFKMPEGKVELRAARQTGSAVSYSEPNGKPAAPTEKKPLFRDVSDDAWYAKDVAYAYEKGLMVGVGEEIFAPEKSLSRGMLVTILHRMNSSPAASGGFADAEGKWYADAAAWAKANGIVFGHDDGRFGGEDPLTREQTAAILYRYCRQLGIDTDVSADALTGFHDSGKISNYAEPAMRWAVEVGLMNGSSDAMLDPQGMLTRAQAAAILHRLCKSIMK